MTARVTRSRQAATTSLLDTKGQALQQEDAAPGRRATQNKARSQAKTSPKVKSEAKAKPAAPKSSSKSIKSTPQIKEELDDDLPHGLGKRHHSETTTAPNEPNTRKKRVKTSPQHIKQQLDDPGSQAIAKKLAAEFSEPITPKATPKKSKSSKNAHVPGSTPFPDYARPTPEECREVNKILSKVHGVRTAPKVIPEPSFSVAGCGQVPYVLEALIRTRLSANTNDRNSSAAFQGIVRRFGLIDNPNSKDKGKVVDWNAVRLAPQKDLCEAIKAGGLANVKSRDIKNILDMVYEENQARREALVSKSRTAPGEENETEQEKQDEIAKADNNMLSLDYIHLLSSDEAFNKLKSYPGIGDKTASCVLLFCLQRPSFAVDTHVWRLCSWLGWVPKNATRDQTFSHCEVRIPDDLKYPLHVLLIRHGKKCSKCQAKMNKNEPDLLTGACVIEHLVKRFNHKNSSGIKRKGTKKSGKVKEEEFDEEESGGLSELLSDEE